MRKRAAICSLSISDQVDDLSAVDAYILILPTPRLLSDVLHSSQKIPWESERNIACLR